MQAKRAAAQCELDDLRILILNNPQANFFNLPMHNPSVLAALNWEGISGARLKVTEQLKAYQRLLRVVPQSHHAAAIALMECNLCSAAQIASLSKYVFTRLTEDVFPGDSELVEFIYDHAQLNCSRIVDDYLDLLQNSGPSVTAARI